MANETGFDPVPWFVAGGAEHSAEVLRTLAHLATGGNEGVARTGDLKVSALAVPAGRVQMAPGSVVMLNRSSAGAPESYVARAPRTSYIDIPTNSSGTTRIDLIGVRIEDPQYPGWTSPPNEEAARFWEYAKPIRIQATTGQLALAREGKLDLGYPAYWCAYLEIPAATGTITAAMIKPLRQLVQANFVTEIAMSGPTPEDALTGAQAEGGKVWPSYAPQIRVPVWATRAAVVATLSSVGLRGGAAQGIFTAVLGGKRAANITFDLDAPTSGGERHTLIVGGQWSDIRDLAGKTVTLQTEARKLLASSNPGYLVTVDGTQVLYDIRFYQDVVE